jgi:hypothetical protein
MPKGSKCSFCNQLTLHIDVSESFRKCATCGFVGWRLLDPVRPGSGKGYRCVNCGKQTLHYLELVPDTNNVAMFRCSTCLYAGVRPNHQQ